VLRPVAVEAERVTEGNEVRMMGRDFVELSVQKVAEEEGERMVRRTREAIFERVWAPPASIHSFSNIIHGFPVLVKHLEIISEY